MKRSPRSACSAQDFGGTPSAEDLARILTETGDGLLSRLVRRQYAKTCERLALMRVITRHNVRENVEQFWIDEANRVVGERHCAYAVRVQFAACLREALSRSRRARQQASQSSMRGPRHESSSPAIGVPT